MAFQSSAFQPSAFQDSGAAPTPPPVVVSAPSGVKRKRRWALKRDGKYYYFDDLAQLQSFKRSEDAIIVPRKTEQTAKSVGHPSIKLFASVGDFDRLREIERGIDAALADERDDDDFMHFLAMI